MTSVLAGEDDAEEGRLKTEAETRRRSHKPRRTLGHRSCKRQDGPSLGAWRGSGALRHLNFGLLTSRP